MRLVQVILGHGDIRLQNLAALSLLPSGQPHVNFGGIGGSIDEFRRRLSGDGPMQLILHGGKEFPGQRRLGIIVGGQRIQVGDLLVKTAFTGPDFPDAFQQFVKIIFAKDLLALF